jgi:hypothetical protein
LKTWHQFWQRVLNNKLLILALACTYLISNSSWSKSYGAIDTIEQLIEGHSTQFKDVLEKSSNNPILLDKLMLLDDVRLAPHFLKSLMFHSEFRFLKLAQNKECTFLSLLENSLFKINSGEINNLLINYKNKKNELQTGLVSKQDYFKFIYKKKCFNNKEIKKLFLNSNLKRTIKSITFNTPKTKNQCFGILKEWQDNIYTPYLCKIPYFIKKGKIAAKKLKNIPDRNFIRRQFYVDQMRQANKLTRLVPFFERSYLDNLCESISNQDNFCNIYLATDVWNKIINGEFPKSRMSYKCKNILRLKEMPTPAQLKLCAQKFNKEFKVCETQGSAGYNSLYPMNNCKSISKALNVSHLKTDYHDCPGMIDNAGIVNIHRIVNHLKPRKVLSTPGSCGSEANFSYAKLHMEFKNEEAWPLRICYRDRLKAKEVCTPYVPGLESSSKLSEGEVIQKILRRMINIPREMKCTSVPTNRYNPNLLQYKVGCYIVFDHKICSSLHCPKKVYVNKKEITGLSFVGRPEFDYFPNSFANEKFAISNIIAETLKVKSKEIRNLTELKVFLDSSKESIVHGIGCIEDIYPTRYPVRAFNQCTPIPFIIDGYFKEHGNIMMSLRTAIDDLHSPHPIVWNYLFNAVVGYKELHPLKLWSLNGLK